jgi:hypothetical protein
MHARAKKKIFFYKKKMTSRTNIFQRQRLSNGFFSIDSQDFRVYDYKDNSKSTAFLSSKKVSLVAIKSPQDEWVSSALITNLVLSDLSGYDTYSLDDQIFPGTEIPIVSEPGVISVQDLILGGFGDLVNFLIRSSYIFTGVPENVYKNYLIFADDFSSGVPLNLTAYENLIKNNDFVFTLKDSLGGAVTDLLDGIDTTSMPLIDANKNKDPSIGFVFSIISIIILAFMLLSSLKN